MASSGIINASERKKTDELLASLRDEAANLRESNLASLNENSALKARIVRINSELEEEKSKAERRLEREREFESLRAEKSQSAHRALLDEKSSLLNQCSEQKILIRKLQDEISSLRQGSFIISKARQTI